MVGYPPTFVEQPYHQPCHPTNALHNQVHPPPPNPTSVADFPFGDELGSFLLKLSLQCKLKGVFPAYIQAITWDDFSSSHKIYNPQYHYLTTSLKTVFPCVHRQEWHPDTCKIRCAAAVIGTPYMTGMIFYTYNG